MLTICLLVTPAIFAATPADYADRVECALDHVGNLLDMTNALRQGERRNAGEEKVDLDEIREDIPVTEKIESGSSTVETSNQWLHDHLKDFENEMDKSKRAVILIEVRERLASLHNAVAEMTGGQASTRSKDEDKQKLAEILEREEYKRVEQKEESLFQQWTRAFFEWLRKIFPKMDVPDPVSGGSTGFSVFLQYVLYAVVIGLIIFVLYKFAPLFFERFGKRVKKEKKERVILGERIAEDESGETLFGEAERLAREGDMRGAIRKGYIAMLCELSDRKIIGLARHKTNRDYLRDVRKQRELYTNVAGLTNTFERHWYGDQRAEINDWEEFRQNFRRTVETAQI